MQNKMTPELYKEIRKAIIQARNNFGIRKHGDSYDIDPSINVTMRRDLRSLRFEGEPEWLLFCGNDSYKYDARVGELFDYIKKMHANQQIAKKQKQHNANRAANRVFNNFAKNCRIEHHIIGGGIKSAYEFVGTNLVVNKWLSVHDGTEHYGISGRLPRNLTEGFQHIPNSERITALAGGMSSSERAAKKLYSIAEKTCKMQAVKILRSGKDKTPADIIKAALETGAVDWFHYRIQGYRHDKDLVINPFGKYDLHDEYENSIAEVMNYDIRDFFTIRKVVGYRPEVIDIHWPADSCSDPHIDNGQKFTEYEMTGKTGKFSNIFAEDMFDMIERYLSWQRFFQDKNADSYARHINNMRFDGGVLFSDSRMKQKAKAEMDGLQTQTKHLAKLETERAILQKELEETWKKMQTLHQKVY